MLQRDPEQAVDLVCLCVRRDALTKAIRALEKLQVAYALMPLKTVPSPVVNASGEYSLLIDR